MNATTFLALGLIVVYSIIGTVAAAIATRFKHIQDEGIHIAAGIFWPLVLAGFVLYWIFIRWIIWLFDALTDDG